MAYNKVSPLCQRWNAEVEANPAGFAEELAGLPTQPRAQVRACRVEHYRPYTMRDVRLASAARKFNFISTFAGGGGSSIGYALAGGKGLIANDFVPEAARTYRLNFPGCLVDRRDIREISCSDEALADFLAPARLKPGEIDVGDGSFPCCEFSTAGRGIGDQDVLRSYSDVMQNNIASLPFDFAEFMHRLRPKVIVCENVPAFETRGREVFHRFVRAIRYGSGSERMYYANWAVLTASDFGIAQKRQRLFVIAIRRDVAEKVGFGSDETVRDAFPAPTRIGVNLRSALADLVQSEREIWPWTRSAMTSQFGSLLRLLPKEPSKPTRLAHLYPNYRKHYTLTRCSWDTPAPTMVVSGQQPDGLTGAAHPRHDRKFTLPELKRITGLPDDFILTGTLSQAAERVCRMVPPLLTKAIAESVYEKILAPYAEAPK